MTLPNYYSNSIASETTKIIDTASRSQRASSSRPLPERVSDSPRRRTTRCTGHPISAPTCAYWTRARLRRRRPASVIQLASSPSRLRPDPESLSSDILGKENRLQSTMPPPRKIRRSQTTNSSGGLGLRGERLGRRNTKNEQRNARFKELLDYRSEHGNCDVPRRQGKLGNRVGTQRTDGWFA